MAESPTLKYIETGHKSNQCRFFKMQVFTYHNAYTNSELVEENFDESAIVLSNKNSSYLDIANYLETHITEKV
ncbi:hypothetical protein [Brumimicrobium mesophilum]|uniref:hypothetical protein n=1 Tax=Brumimicrobium mesophilum TaxID=392717 RepID=UPI001F1CE14E|nr:hypothetical protein [Brumimicrobium mesophilum]